ncbi:MAG: hypothetical protein KDA92_08755 [Planctomycetales bacterium]|nr:hypothetical protein [Planctomycetales bacterium]
MRKSTVILLSLLIVLLITLSRESRRDDRVVAPLRNAIGRLWNRVESHAQQGRAAALPETFFDVMNLMDRFESEETAHLEFVRVATGRWPQAGHARVEDQYKLGYLTVESDGRFSVRYIDGSRGDPQVGCVTLDLVQHVRNITQHSASSNDDQDDLYLFPHALAAPLAEKLLIAHACFKRGGGDEARLLFESIADKKLAIWQLGAFYRDRLTMDFADPAITRDELLRRHRQWLNIFFISESDESVALRADGLEHAMRGDLGFALPWQRSDEASALVSTLHDGYFPVCERAWDGWFIPTSAVRPAKGTSAAEKLQALGFKAVPALLGALNDSTPTRTVWYCCRFGGHLEVVTVGDCAEDLLVAISGLRFWGTAAECETQWRRWWKSVANIGEENTLVEMAHKGDRQSIQAANVILNRWPNRVGDILVGIHETQDIGTRADLITMIAKVETPLVTEFLVDEWTESGDAPIVRCALADALFTRGQTEPMSILLEEWSCRASLAGNRDDNCTIADECWFLAHTAHFLVGTGDLSAIRTIRDALPTLPQDVKTAIVEECCAADLNLTLTRVSPQQRTLVEHEIRVMLAH